MSKSEHGNQVVLLAESDCNVKFGMSMTHPTFDIEARILRT